MNAPRSLRRPYRILALLMFCAALGLAWVPLLADPGFENALTQALLIALLSAAWSAICARRGFQGWLRPCEAGSALAAFDQGALAALAGALGLALLGGLATWAATLLRPACNLSLWLQWHLLLPGVTAVVVPGLVFPLASLVPGRIKPWIAAYALILGIVLWCPYLFLTQPLTVFYNPVFGFFPGPIYDSVVRIDQVLLISRALDLCWAGLALSTARLLARLRADRSIRILRSAEPLLIALCAAALIAGHAQRGELGFGVDRGMIQRTLGGRAESAHFVYIFPLDSRVERELPRLMLEHEYRYQQDIKFLGIDFPRKVTSYIYSGPGQKKRLMGAADTSYADIRSAEMHINFEPFPHPVLKHELLHVLAGPLGLYGLGFSSNHGLTEGLAEACEGYSGEFSEHDWAWAMQRLGMLPDPEQVMSATGFFRIQGARAYITAGSFVLWLIERCGMPVVRRLYARPDFEAELGLDLPELSAQWRAFIEQYPGDPRVLAAAEARFSRQGLFETSCGRELARLLEQADGLLAEGRCTKARESYTQALELAPESADALYGLARVDLRSKRYDSARSAIESALDAPGQTALDRAALQLLLGDVLFSAGQRTAAEVQWRMVYDAHAAAWLDRAIFARLTALVSPAIEPLAAYLIDDEPEAASLRRLELARQADPQQPLIDYLLGRRLFQVNSYTLAEPLLARASSAEITDPATRREARLLLGHCRVLLADYAGAEQAYAAVLEPGDPAGLRMMIDELVGLCRLGREQAKPSTTP